MSNPCSAQVVILMENLPFLESPQHTELGIELARIGAARINYNWTESTSELSLVTSHSLLPFMNCYTSREVLMRERPTTLSKLAKLSFVHQLSS